MLVWLKINHETDQQNLFYTFLTMFAMVCSIYFLQCLSKINFYPDIHFLFHSKFWENAHKLITYYILCSVSAVAEHIKTDLPIEPAYYYCILTRVQLDCQSVWIFS